MTDQPSHSDWDRVASLFDEARHLPPDQRVAFVVTATPEHPSVRADVLEMLGVVETDVEFGIESWLRGHAGNSAQRVAQVGPWRIVRPLGQGGMGEVYLAERVGAPFTQHVALKVLRAGLVGAEARARFDRERRILARLTHPAIVPFVDGGVADDGRPYLVMQYVDGQPITTDADARRLSIPARLRQLIVVCRAVQHAHSHLVVHRDLKPSNILVDADGTARLLDFGIARMLAPEDGDPDAGITRETAAPLTPSRAAPEQLRGEPPTIAADVWALGVLLHEMLTGHLPFVLEPGPLAAMADEITRRELTRPSRLVLRRSPASGDTTAERFADARATTPERLSRLLRGDLETIVGKALHTRAERRYESAGALADDIAAFLDGRPVTARPDSVAYRMRRFVGRHRAASAAAVVGVVALAALTTGTLLQNRRVARERDRATAESVKARAVADLLVGLLQGSGPTQGAGVDKVSIADLLARGAKQVDDLAGQPDVQSRLLHTLAQIHASRSEVPIARELFERAVSVRGNVDDADPDRAAMLIDYAVLLTSRLDRRADAKALMARLVARVEASPTSSPAIRGRALQTLAMATRGDEGKRLAERALQVRRAIAPPATEAVADNLNALAELAFERSDAPAARAYWRESLTLIESLKGPDDVHSVTVLANLANVIEDPREAVEINRRIVGARTRMFGDNAVPVAFATTNLGVALVRIRDHAGAEQSFRQAQVLWERLLGPTHRQTLSNLRNIGRVQDLQERYAEALATFEVLDARMRDGGAAPVDRAEYDLYRGMVLRHLGRVDDAERVLLRAHRLLSSAQPGRPVEVSAAAIELGRIGVSRGQFEAARTWFADALTVREREAPTWHEMIAEARAELGRALIALGRPAEGRPMLEAALPTYDAWHLARPPDTAALRAALLR